MSTSVSLRDSRSLSWDFGSTRTVDRSIRRAWPTWWTGLSRLRAKQLQSFLGFVNYLRDFVPKISTITAPLNAIRLKDNIPEQWTPECAHAFQLLKEIIPQCPPLAHPDFARPFYVATDASAVGIGCVLYQLDDKTNAPQYIQFQARALRKSERNYSATKRELLAIVFAFARFRHFVYGRHFTLYTDHHALVYLRTQPHLNAMMQTWYDELFEYDFTVKHRPGVQNVLPDHLSRLFPPSRLEGEGASAKATVNEPGAEEPAQSRVTVRKTTTTTADSDPHQPTRSRRRTSVRTSSVATISAVILGLRPRWTRYTKPASTGRPWQPKSRRFARNAFLANATTSPNVDTTR